MEDQTVNPLFRNLSKTTVVLGLTFFVASAATAQRPRPQPPSPPPPPPPSATAPAPQEAAKPSAAKLARVDERLQAYATAEARKELGALAQEKDVRALVALGRILEQEKAYKDAEKSFRDAASRAPRDPAPWAHLGFTYFHQKREADGKKAYKEALSRAQAAVKKDPKDATARYYLGVANLYLGKHAAAEPHLKQARALSPGDPMPVFELAVSRLSQKKWSEAVALFSEALAMDEDLAYAYYYRGQASSRLGKKDKLIADLKRFLELAPQAPEAPLAARTVAASKR